MTQRTEIPFFGNHNNASCGQCVYRMMLSYFYPDSEWLWSEMDELCGAVQGKYTWPYLPMTKLSEMGLDVHSYSVFDTEEFLKSPQDYLLKLYGEVVAKDQMDNSDINAVLKQAQTYLDYLKANQIKRTKSYHSAEILRQFLDEGYLIMLWVNSRDLNNETGVAGHFILIHGYDEKNFIAHDPGGNNPDGSPSKQHPNRIISEEILYKACCPKETGKTNIMISIKAKNKDK